MTEETQDKIASRKRAYMWTLIGDSGDGKTYTAGTLVENEALWPFAVLDTDGGLESMSRVLGASKGCLEIVSDATTHREVLRALHRLKTSGIKTLIYDGITRTDEQARCAYINRLMTSESKDRKAKLRAEESASRNVSMEAGRETSWPTRSVIAALVDLKKVYGINIVCTAWKGDIVSPSFDEKTGKMKGTEIIGIGAALSRAPAKSLKLASDFMWMLDREPVRRKDENGVEYTDHENLMTVACTRRSQRARRLGYIHVKSRINNIDLPAVYRNPHLGNFYDKLIACAK